jgi:hypothetical protein
MRDDPTRALKPKKVLTVGTEDDHITLEYSVNSHDEAKAIRKRGEAVGKKAMPTVLTVGTADDHYIVRFRVTGHDEADFLRGALATTAPTAAEAAGGGSAVEE